ncbi:MAG: serine/threonine protein kinase, partial [Myxococcales bacterium]|nr:serine/threonine protein kinase [Myxococcales bacterium]
MDPRGPANPREREANRDAPECLLATLPSETDAGDRRSSAPPRLQGDRVRKELVMSRLFKGRVETPTIGRFEIVRPIGAGAMGVVYEARDPKLGRRVALKVLQSTETERSPRARARMLREAQAMAHVAHPNIVTVHDAGEVEGQVFLAMELVRGITLEHWMEAPDQRARPWREVVRVFVDAGRGLAAAHAAGIVHRDFK